MKKVLIIEDNRTDFNKISLFLGKKYTILPSIFEEMSASIEYPTIEGKNINDFVIQQINDNYKDIGLILCDIKLGDKNMRGGNGVVKSIRNHKIWGSPNWTLLVPIIAITNYADRQESIIDAGADFSLVKPKNKVEESYFSALVDNHVDKFEKRLESKYPLHLKDEIRNFKNNHLNLTAFIMTSFADEHVKIANQVIKVLEKYNIVGCLANKAGGENHDDLWSNIEVFIHGCDFGIGIYADDSIIKGKDEENTSDLFKRIRINPNMSQEVGYMLGLQKKVCILKDKKLDKLPVDLASKLYVEYEDFDDLEIKIGEWLVGKVLQDQKNM